MAFSAKLGITQNLYIIFHKVKGFIRDYGGLKYLVLFLKKQ